MSRLRQQPLLGQSKLGAMLTARPIDQEPSADVSITVPTSRETAAHRRPSPDRPKTVAIPVVGPAGQDLLLDASIEHPRVRGRATHRETFLDQSRDIAISRTRPADQESFRQDIPLRGDLHNEPDALAPFPDWPNSQAGASALSAGQDFFVDASITASTNRCATAHRQPFPDRPTIPARSSRQSADQEAPCQGIQFLCETHSRPDTLALLLDRPNVGALLIPASADQESFPPRDQS